jgi:TolB-like protein
VSVVPVLAQDARAGVEQIAAQLIKGAPEGRQLRVAVADFPDLQNVTCDLGRYVANRLTTRLTQSAKFLVIERQRLSQVLTELKFSMSDLVDPSKAKQLGRQVGVETIVVGTVSDLGNQIDLDARMIDIETNRMLLGVSTTISRDQVVDEMLKRGCQQIAGSAAPGASTPKGSAPGSGGLQGLRFGHKFFTFEVSNIELVGDEVKIWFTYVNRKDEPANGNIDNGLNSTYLVDNQGNRYGTTGNSFDSSRTFPPQIPERIWVSFGKLRPAVSTMNLVLRWWAGESANVVIRGIPASK